MDKPLVAITAAVAVGMAMAALVGQLSFYAALILGLGCILVVLRTGINKLWLKKAGLVWLAAMGMLWFLAAGQPQSVLKEHTGERAVVTGQVNQVEDRGNLQVLTLRLKSFNGQTVRNKEYIKVSLVKALAGQYRYGELLQVKGRLESIPEGGNPDSFSYREYMEKKYVFSQMRCFIKPEVLGQSGGMLGKIADAFANKTHLLAISVMPEREEGIFRGILFGDTTGMSPADKNVFSTTGVLHAFAVSGSNVAFVLFLGLMTFRFLPRPVCLTLTALAVIFYTVLTGAGGPVLRASIMALVVLGGYALNRRGNPLNSLAFSALGMLIYKPGYLTDPGFQLSFAATWGLIEVVPQMENPYLPKMLKQTVLFSVAAELATLPLLAYYFYQVSLIGVLANVLVEWFLALILEIGLAGAALGMLWHTLGQLMFAPLSYLITATIWLLQVLAKAPGAALWVVKPPLWIVLLYYLILMVWVKRKYLQEKLIATGQIVFKRFNKLSGKSVALSGAITGLILLVMIGGFSFPGKGDLDVQFLDVGQGDSILINTPSGKHFLVDGGPRNDRFDAGTSIIIPYLLAKGIKHLNGVFMTHPHDDHDGGLVEVVRNIPVQDFYRPPISGSQEAPGLWLNLTYELRAKQIAQHQLQAGTKVSLDNGVSLLVLSPGVPFAGSRSDFNNNCLVMKLTYGKRSILLTGDMELEAMAQLENDFPGDITIFKVPHHGSKYGLEPNLLNQLHPAAAVISVGKNNFGQPAPQVVQYWRERNIPVLRTDKDGMIEVNTNGQSLQVFSGRTHKLRLTLC